MRLKHVKNFFGLGAAGELTTVCDNKVMWAWTNLHIKVYLGSFIWLINLKVSRKRKAVLDGKLGQTPVHALPHGCHLGADSVPAHDDDAP